MAIRNTADSYDAEYSAAHERIWREEARVAKICAQNFRAAAEGARARAADGDMSCRDDWSDMANMLDDAASTAEGIVKSATDKADEEYQSRHERSYSGAL